MEITVGEMGGAVVVAVVGDIDGKTAPEAQKKVLGELRQGGRVLLDLSGTRYMSSAGLRVLLLVHREATARAAKLVLVGVRPDVREVMNATGFLRYFTLVDSVDAAAALAPGGSAA